MARKLMLLAVSLCVLSLFVGCQNTTPPDTELPGAPPKAGKAATGEKTKLRIYVPCGMIIPFKAVIDKFEADNPNVDIDGVYDNAIVLAKRLTEKNEKADVFVSPGLVEISQLEKDSKIDDGTKKTIGTFELVVIVQKGNPLGIKTPEDLKKAKTISTPDPDLNSVGVSGKEALTKLGLYDGLQKQMIKTQHAIESHSWVAGGRTQAGIAYRNCPLETNPEKLSKSKVEIAFDFDPDTYEKQPCLIAMLKDAEQPDLAKKFIDFVASKEGLQILADKGMTGCLDDLTAVATPAPTGNEIVEVRAFYPDNEGHQKVKKMIVDLMKKYPGQVRSEFIDFTSDEGFDKWQAAGLTCGAILVNDEQSWTYDKNGKPYEVTFKMAIGGEWTEEDLNAVIKKIIADKK